MKQIKLIMIVIAATSLILLGFNNVYARGGGGHGGGGGRGGGGWSGGHGGEGGHGQYNHDHPDHHYNNNNYYYGYGGGWGYGVDDDAIIGLDVDTTETQPSTVIVEQSPADTVQQSAPVAAPIGAQVTMLPPESQGRIVNGTQFYKSGDTWYKPYFGASDVYYEVVSPPGDAASQGN